MLSFLLSAPLGTSLLARLGHTGLCSHPGPPCYIPPWKDPGCFACLAQRSGWVSGCPSLVPSGWCSPALRFVTPEGWSQPCWHHSPLQRQEPRSDADGTTATSTPWKQKHVGTYEESCPLDRVWAQLATKHHAAARSVPPQWNGKENGEEKVKLHGLRWGEFTRTTQSKESQQ